MRFISKRGLRLDYAQLACADHPPTRIPVIDEERIAAEFFAHSSSGLEGAYRAFGTALYSVARRILGNDADAQDCVHDVLLRIWDRKQTYRPEYGALRAYLLVSVRNEALTRTRETVRHTRIEEEALRRERDVFEFEASDPVERGRIRAAVETLPAGQRAALALVYVGQFTHIEAAARLQIPLGTVKGRIRLALAKLHTALREPP